MRSSWWQTSLIPNVTNTSHTLRSIIYAFVVSLSISDISDISEHLDSTTKRGEIVEKNFNIMQLAQFQYAQTLAEYKNILEKIGLKIGQKDYEMKAQYNFFHKSTGSFLGSIPCHFDPTQRQLYFVTDSEDFFEIKSFYAESVIFPIEKISLLFKTFGFFCFFCRKYFTTKGCFHRCKIPKTCFACHRAVALPSTFITTDTINYFCQVSSKSSNFVCNKCHVTYYSENCLEHHLKHVCRFGWKCSNCNIYQHISKHFKSIEDIKQRHNCYERICQFCGERKTTNHFCTINKVNFSEEFTDLAFFQIDVRGFLKIRCDTCFYLPTDTFCGSCKKDSEDVIQCTAFLRNQNSMKYNAYIFRDNNLGRDKIIEDILENTFLPANKTHISIPRKKKVRFYQRAKPILDTNIFDQDRLNCIEKFLKFIIESGNTNYTFVTQSNESGELLHILKVLCQNGFSPKIFKRNSQILLIEETRFSLRFIDLQNYIDIPLRILAKSKNIELPFFPFKWLNQKQFSYVGVPPTSLKDFFNFEDTNSDILEKESFLKKVKDPWSLGEELQYYSIQKTKVTAITCLDFVKNSFFSQEQLSHHLNLEIVHYLHPFNAPLFTIASYAFKLFLLFCKESKRIKLVNKPINFPSSKGEIQFVSYIAWKFPDIKIQHGWSPYGQKKFLHAIPDGYTEGKCWFYNGCYYHGHNPKHCLQKNIKNPEARLEKEKSFFEKMAKLKEAENVEIIVKWECKWRQDLKQNPDVKYFMENIFRDPPCHRLNPRDAGKTLKKYLSKTF